MEKYRKSSKIRSKRKHGFRKRAQSRGGKNVLKRRGLRGRKRVV
jgi:ribosomal protein L34